VPATAIFPIPKAERSSIFDGDLISLNKFIDGSKSTEFADNLIKIWEETKEKVSIHVSGQYLQFKKAALFSSF